MVLYAREFHQDRSNVTVIQADILDVELPEQSFDLVLCIGALHHMSDVKAILSRLHRWSKPGSWIIAIEPQRANPLIQMARFIRKRVDSTYDEDQRYFSRSEVLHVFQQTGYQQITLQHQGYISKPFGEVILPFRSIAQYVSKFSVFVDTVLDKRMPSFLRFLSWDIIIRGRFP